MDFIRKHGRHLSGVAFIVGFTLDYIFTPRIDNPYTPLILGGYLVIAGITILAVQLFERTGVKRPLFLWLISVLPATTQLIFGAMMSMLFVYYSRSATLSGSWPFMLLLGGMFLGSEVFRDRVRLFKFQLITFFFVFYMAMALCVPIALRELGTTPFLIAGGTSLLGTILFVKLVSVLSRKAIRESAPGIFVVIGGIYLLINVLYFSHLIPPIPLSLRDSGVYHSVSRDVSGNYTGVGEKLSWQVRYGLQKNMLHLSPGEPAYFYSAVFAPVAIKAPIVHLWEWEDPKTEEWSVLHRVSFPIVGGRDGGDRVYSKKESVFSGKWRVSIETASGELLGRESFNIVVSENSVFLQETVLK